MKVEQTKEFKLLKKLLNAQIKFNDAYPLPFTKNEIASKEYLDYFKAFNAACKAVGIERTLN